MSDKKDMFGQEIKAGDFIVYGVRSGNTGGLNVALVDDPSRMSIFVQSGRKSNLHYTGRCVVVDPKSVPENIASVMLRARAEATQ